MPYEALLKGRISIPGQAYVTTTVTTDRQEFFRSLPLGRCVINALRHQDLAGYSRTLACVVMPDHVHWLLQLTGELSLSEVMRRFKGLASNRVNLLRNERGPIWQKGFHDHALRTDESLLSVARYVVENPLRAGLVERLSDYSLWHCTWESSG